MNLLTIVFNFKYQYPTFCTLPPNSSSYSSSIQVERFRKEGAQEKAKAIQVLATEIVPSYPTKVEIGDEG